MGHRFSKTAANNIATTANRGVESTINSKTTTTTSNNLQQQSHSKITTTTTRTIPIPNGANHFVGPTINLQIQESPTASAVTTCCNSTTTAKSSSSSATTATTAVANNSSIQQQQHSSSIVTGCIGGTGSSSNCSSLTSVNNLSCGRQIIIKIQLAKMENGNELQQQQQQDSSLENITADCNLNSTELLSTSTTTNNGGGGGGAGAAQILNLTLNNSSSGNNTSSLNMASTLNTTAMSGIRRTAGSSSTVPSSLATNNNYLNPSKNSTNFTTSTDASSTAALAERLGRMNTLQFNDEIVEQNIGEIVEYCEVLEGEQQQLPIPPVPPPTTASSVGNTKAEEAEIETNACCRRKSKSLAANGGASSANSKRRCRKCIRDAFRRMLDPSLSFSSKAQKQQQQLERKEQISKQAKAHERHSISNPLNTNRNLNPIANLMPQRNSIHSTLVVPNSSGATAAAMMAAAAASAAASASSSAAAASSVTNQLAVWAPVTATTTTNGSDVIIPLTTPPQFVVVQCAIVNPPLASNSISSSIVSTAATSNGLLPATNSIISITHNTATPSSASMNNDNNIMVKVPVPPATNSNSSILQQSRSSVAMGNGNAALVGPIVHSQVDFVHYLVPDLERITNSSFYWGKMDRYEAERLLEGKPEGTFLLRDSAQEEFLFSVTFRKYGRSLHARIEQSGHQFSFDCHDPCVFTAPTVTGLLEHYKDPACVMFFEPMLTIPLHRKSCFSLQKLCRATIVSNTTYDGINELELPTRLKSYLKEYHYKQKLRVKSNETTYTIHCK